MMKEGIMEKATKDSILWVSVWARNGRTACEIARFMGGFLEGLADETTTGVWRRVSAGIGYNGVIGPLAGFGAPEMWESDFNARALLRLDMDLYVGQRFASNRAKMAKQWRQGLEREFNVPFVWGEPLGNNSAHMRQELLAQVQKEALDQVAQPAPLGKDGVKLRM